MLKVGFAQIEIVPDNAEPFMGHLRDDYSAEGIHDPLYCKAMVLDDGATPSLSIISMDLCMISDGLVDRIRKVVRKTTKIQEDRLLIAATHTHASAASFSLYGAPSPSEGFIERLVNLTAECCRKAEADLQPASLRYGETQVPGIAFYRRLDAGNDRVRMNWENPEEIAGFTPAGHPDETLRVLVFKRNFETGILVNYPLHPAILDYQNHLRSADFPGYMARRIAEIRGKEIPCLFLNGFCGNINHLNPADTNLPRRGFKAVERVGEALATGVIKAMDSATTIETEPVFQTSLVTNLKRIQISGKKEQTENSATGVEGTDGLPPKLARDFREKLALLQDTSLKAEIQVLRLGPLALVALPGEIFTELGDRLRTQFDAVKPGSPLICSSLSNGAIGYVPHQVAFAQGGYETIPGVTKIAPGQGEVLVDTTMEALTRLFAITDITNQ